MVGSDDAQMREGEFVELLVDTGATEHVCGPHDVTHAALTSGPRPALKTATGELLKHYGPRTVCWYAESAPICRGGLFVLQCQVIVVGTCG